jgi:hypothetical protein
VSTVLESATMAVRPDTMGTDVRPEDLELSGDRIAAFHAFLDTRLFPVFGLPSHLDH